jgi:bifunctional non-homologous end joining protein LigD
MEVGKHTIEITHAEKVLFPQQGITKGDLIDYYQRIAQVMLPYLERRPVSLQRFPNGINESGFYQKEAPDYFPDWIDQVEIDLIEEHQKQPQVVINNTATLVYLANQAMITPHTWLSRVDKLDDPDQLIFDLDPVDGDFGVVREAARDLEQTLEEVGLAPFLKTTGSRGLHVLVPLDRSADFDQVRDFARDLVELLARRFPDRMTTEVRKEKRQGRLFLDYLRNAYAQTAVAPYAVRALPGAPVATPLDWDELGDTQLDSRRFTMQNIFRRLGQKDDPWKGMMSEARGIKEPRQRLQKLLSEE